MEDEGTKAPVGEKRPRVEVDIPSSPFSTTAAASGTKTEVKGGPLVLSDVNDINAWALKYNIIRRRGVDHAPAAVSGTTTEVEGSKHQHVSAEEADTEDLIMYRFEGGKLIPIGKRRKPPRMKMGPLPPNAITYEKICRREDEAKLACLRAGIQWHPWLFAYDDPLPTPTTPTASASRL